MYVVSTLQNKSATFMVSREIENRDQLIGSNKHELVSISIIAHISHLDDVFNNSTHNSYQWYGSAFDIINNKCCLFYRHQNVKSRVIINFCRPICFLVLTWYSTCSSQLNNIVNFFGCFCCWTSEAWCINHMIIQEILFLN